MDDYLHHLFSSSFSPHSCAYTGFACTLFAIDCKLTIESYREHYARNNSLSFFAISVLREKYIYNIDENKFLMAEK
jgi:hypothetical protein